jgi:hypothetical protein
MNPDIPGNFEAGFLCEPRPYLLINLNLASVRLTNPWVVNLKRFP